MGITINFLNFADSDRPITQNSKETQQKKTVSVFNSPFDRKHQTNEKEIPKDGIFQLDDVKEIDEYCKIELEDLKALKQYDGKPWSKKIYNKTASFLLNNIDKLKSKDSADEWAESSCVASLLDKLCYKGIVLSNENKQKVIEIADEYGWQLPKSFRDCLNEEQSLYFDFLADDFERSGMDKYAKEVKEITEEGHVIYKEEE